MIVNQLSVFIENKKGRMAEVTSILQNAEVCIYALILADTSDFGVLRMIVSDNETAEAALKAEGFIVGKSGVIAVEIEDNPAGLSRILFPLSDADINIEYMYSFPNIRRKLPIMIFRSDDPQKALNILTKEEVTLVSHAELCTQT